MGDRAESPKVAADRAGGFHGGGAVSDVQGRFARAGLSRGGDNRLGRADELSKQRGNFVIRSTHDTASGKTTITVSSHSFMLYVVIAIAGLILLLKLL